MSKNKIVDPSHPVDYTSGKTPPNYKCFKCDSAGCKLWREYQTFLDTQVLYCAKCAGRYQDVNISSINVNGKYIEKEHRYLTDQIGSLIPAVPTVENDTYWGYTSVPEDGCVWWKNLPTLPQ